MLDTIDAVLHHTNDFVYFFKGNQYLKWKPGEGVVPLRNGSRLRTLGVTGWQALPDEFKQGIDAAFYYPPTQAVYFFRGSQYVKWKNGAPEYTADGRIVRDIGITGWSTFPASFRTGIDTAFYNHENGAAYFFKGRRYLKYEEGTGVVPHNGNPIRELGITGWDSLPVAFKDGLDAAMYYRENDKIYFFKGRRYARWEPDLGLDPRYPRRIGLRHGQDMKGGWPGLSHIVSGPLIGHTTPNSARIWLWLADAAA